MFRFKVFLVFLFLFSIISEGKTESRALVPMTIPCPALVNPEPPIPLDVLTKIERSAPVKIAVRSEDGSLEAVAQAPVFADSKRSQGLQVSDVSSGQPIFSAEFADIRWMQFIDNTSLMAIMGTKPSDGEKARLYLLNYRNKSVQAQTLELPANKNWGVGVSQILSRADLPYLVVIQDSANSLGDVTVDRIDPRASNISMLLNQGAFAFDPQTLKPAEAGSLTYGDLVPRAAALNPKSTFVAFHLVDPILAHVRSNTIGIVDLKNPTHLLFQYRLPQDNILVGPSKGNFKLNEDANVRMHWSPDGRYLLTVERMTGYIMIYDTKTKKDIHLAASEGTRFPTADARFLEHNQVLVLRYGEKDIPQGDLNKDRSLFASITPVGTIAKNGLDPMSFEVQLSLDPKVDARRKTPLDNVKAVLEFQKNRVLALVLDDQVILIDRQNPNRQTVAALASSTGKSSVIQSAIKMSDSTLRVIDVENGVADIVISPL